MEATFFATQEEFRAWLAENHEKETELIVGYYKIGSGKPSMTWPQSVDQALCFGWIDGIRRSIDKDSYQIRFTKRKENSNWSLVNLRKVEELSKLGLMEAAGLAIFEKRKDKNSERYSYENGEIGLSPEFEEEFKKEQKAWAYFQTLAPSYKRTCANWIMSAKQETTRIKRLKEIIAESEAGTNRWKNNKYAK